VPGIEFRSATADDIPPLARMLSRAFQDDPVQRWMCPDDARRRRMNQALFMFLLSRVYLPGWLVYTTSDLGGVAPWAPPGQWQVPMRKQVGLGPMMFRSCGRRLLRVLQGFHAMEARHKQRSEDHYYLHGFGVDPSLQGKGYGSSLLAAMACRCDQEGMGAYLEASSSRSAALYYRHGFEQVDAVDLPDSGPTINLMWRKHRVSGSVSL